jgi:hypothetical protein
MGIKIAQIDTSSIEFHSFLLTSLFLQQSAVTKSPRGRNVNSYFQGIVRFDHDCFIWGWPMSALFLADKPFKRSRYIGMKGGWPTRWVGFDK